MDKKNFLSKDIGAQLLPIITKGIYRDPLDTLREYIQNSIDAGTRRIDLSISSDLVSIRDYGDGMSHSVARSAIRLGISEKNPSSDIGFRGIGIYSAFNTCSKLEIYTKPRTGKPSKITFDFKRIRKLLAEEENKKLAGEKSELCLEELLTNAVFVEDLQNVPFKGQGTLVMMTGLRSEVQKRFTDRISVKKYLQGVIPLPFSSDFKFRNVINRQLDRISYRFVDLNLSFNGESELLYRPYYNDMFTHGGSMEPKFFDLKNPLGSGTLGFAWVCLNDARKILPDQTIRGLLIRKFDFAVGDRSFFAKFFSRVVVNKRITGEIIITRTDIIPNAARTEFEPGQLRDSLHMSFSTLASKINSWAENVQNELKALEEIDTISPKVFKALKEIPTVERDVARLLVLNTDMSTYEDTLNIHLKVLRKLKRNLLERTQKAIKDSQNSIAKILSRTGKTATDRGKRIAKSIKDQENAPKKEELVYTEDVPQNILAVMRSADIETTPEIRVLIKYIDREILRAKLSEREYEEMLYELINYLDESL